MGAVIVDSRENISVISTPGSVNERQWGNESPSAQKPRLLDQVRIALRTNHYSSKMEESYAGWIKKFILFNNKTHPEQLGGKEIQLWYIDMHVRAYLCTVGTNNVQDN